MIMRPMKELKIYFCVVSYFTLLRVYEYLNDPSYVQSKTIYITIVFNCSVA